MRASEDNGFASGLRNRPLFRFESTFLASISGISRAPLTRLLRFEQLPIGGGEAGSSHNSLCSAACRRAIAYTIQRREYVACEPRRRLENRGCQVSEHLLVTLEVARAGDARRLLYGKHHQF